MYLDAEMLDVAPRPLKSRADSPVQQITIVEKIEDG